MELEELQRRLQSLESMPAESLALETVYTPHFEDQDDFIEVIGAYKMVTAATFLRRIETLERGPEVQDVVLVYNAAETPC